MQWQTTIQEFLNHLLTERNVSENTEKAYRNDLTQFGEYLSANLPADADWTRVTSNTLHDFVISMAGRYTSSTTARKIAAIKTMFHWLNQRGLVVDDPSLRLKSPKVEKKAPRIMTEDEVYRLFEAASAALTPRSLRDRALLELIYSTGMRVSEAISLKLSDMDFVNGTAKCDGKGSRQRNAPLTPRATQALQNYIENARKEMLGENAGDYIFLNPVGSRLTRQAVWMTTRQYATNAKIDGEVTPHTLRHSRAAHMLNSGEDVRKVQEWFGHANLATTQMYTPKEKDNKLAVV
jgi:integrase/recombinase XerD